MVIDFLNISVCILEYIIDGVQMLLEIFIITTINFSFVFVKSNLANNYIYFTKVSHPCL